MTRTTAGADELNEMSCVSESTKSDEPLPVKHRKYVSDWIEAVHSTGLNTEATTKSSSLIDIANEAEEGCRKLGLTFRELRNLDLPNRKEVLFGLARKEVGLMNAVTNTGKSTILRNLMIAGASGRPFMPFGEFSEPLRIALLDFEDSLAALRDDLNTMTLSLSETGRSEFDDNILILCECRGGDGAELNLSRSDHLEGVTLRLIEFRPDLIIVDTIASAFSVRSENDNAEVKTEIMNPLRYLARRANSSLLAGHHIGKAKSEKGRTTVASHRGRGASSFADMARTIFNLEPDRADDSIILSCAKIKGSTFEDTRIVLNTATRWFEAKGIVPRKNSYRLLLEVFADGNEYPTSELISRLSGIVGERSVKEQLRYAVGIGDLIKVRHGIYKKSFDMGESAKVQNV
jgi:hypothetical protein